MIAKTIFYVAAVSFVTGCASTVAATTEKEHVEQEVVYRPVEEVWPDVVPQKPRSNPKTPTKNSSGAVAFLKYSSRYSRTNPATHTPVKQTLCHMLNTVCTGPGSPDRHITT